MLDVHCNGDKKKLNVFYFVNKFSTSLSFVITCRVIYHYFYGEIAFWRLCSLCLFIVNIGFIFRYRRHHRNSTDNFIPIDSSSLMSDDDY